MKTLFRILAILLLAVALTLAGSLNPGYVLLVYPPYRVELSLNLMLALLAAVFFIAYGLLRVGKRVLGLPAYVHDFKQQQRHESARKLMNDGLQAFAGGHYSEAEKHAAAALALGEMPELTALIAARSAHALKAFERRDAFLAQIGKSTADYPDSGMAG